MELRIYDNTLNLHAVVEGMTSLIWTRRFWEVGEFSFVIPFSPELMSILIPRRLVMKPGDDEAGEIQSVTISKSKEGYDEMEVSGKFITQWLDKRCLNGRYKPFTRSTSQEIIEYLVDRHCIDDFGGVTNRIMPLLSIYSPSLTLADYYYSCTYLGSLLEEVQSLAQSVKLGFWIIVDLGAGGFVFSLRKGRDKTALIFSSDYDNVLEQEYEQSIENYKNVMYVWGTNDDPPPDDATTMIWRSGESEAEGLERDECAYSTTMLSADDTTSIKPQAEIESRVETVSLDSVIHPDANYRYRVDYDVGDRITCVNTDWGVSRVARIVEAQETYEHGDEGLTLTFGDSGTNLIQKIRQEAKKRG